MHRTALLILLAALLAGCPPAADAPQEEAEEPTPAPRAGPEYSGGECPAWEHGWNEGFETGGLERDFRLVLPDDPEGAPVVFVWHWLGGDANQIVDWLDFDDLADDGAIVIAPDSSRLPLEWRTTEGPEGNADLDLFEDLLACAYAHYGADMDRVYATGMSAGGLWTSYLTMYESHWLAATAPMSGGVTPQAYSTPEQPIPVLLTWGGSSDLYQGFSFEDATLLFSDLLREDDHFVAHCEHALGHNVPDGAAAMVWEFFQAHPAGAGTSPYADGLPGSFPSFCGLPDDGTD